MLFLLILHFQGFGSSSLRTTLNTINIIIHFEGRNYISPGIQNYQEPLSFLSSLYFAHVFVSFDYQIMPFDLSIKGRFHEKVFNHVDVGGRGHL